MQGEGRGHGLRDGSLGGTRTKEGMFEGKYGAKTGRSYRSRAATSVVKENMGWCMKELIAEARYISSSHSSSGKSPTVTLAGRANPPYLWGHEKYRCPSTLPDYYKYYYKCYRFIWPVPRPGIRLNHKS